MTEPIIVSGSCKSCGKTLVSLADSCEDCEHRVKCLLHDTPICVPYFCNDCWHEGTKTTTNWRGE